MTSKKKQKALIVCNGEAPSKTLAHKLAPSVSLVVAADGGANLCRKLGILPHVIIGDLDSVDRGTTQHFSSSEIIKVRRQDNTDLEKALDYVIDRNISEVTIVGATGIRVDFTLGNFSVAWVYAEKINMRFVGDGWFAAPIVKRVEMAAPKRTRVSLIPFGECSGITVHGLRYPLTNARMRVGEIGVSNVVEKSPFSVEVREGSMMIFVFRSAIR